MRNTFMKLSCAAAAAMSLALSVDPASAACTRLAFSVNDYGKEGPTNDAKQLLDKYIAKKMAERGIAKYTTGKKDVTCELFLDVLLFDEHTCKAEATVCWDGSVPQGGVDQTAGGEPAKDAPAKAAAKKPAKSDAAIETGSTDKAPAAAPAKEPAAAAAKEEAPAAEDAPAAAAAEEAPAAQEAAPEGGAQ